MASYKYRSLSGDASDGRDSKSIRLLELLPSTQQQPTLPLRCRIIHVLMSSLPQYEALSYCWGDKPERLQLDVLDDNGKTTQLRTTRNLFDALVRLRREYSTRLLWVDALCINQEDGAEKSEQIQLMRKIYQQATEVAIWLGNASATSDHALGVIPLLLSAEEEDTITGRMRNLALPADRPEYFPLLSDPVWKHLSDILERPWFRRAWIVQEVAAARRATIFCGDATVDLDDLLQAMLYVITRNLQAFLHQGMVNMTRLWCLTDNRKSFAEQKDRTPLVVFLREREALASDPRDKIFAFHGLFPSGSFGAAVSRPNYNLSCSEIYTQVAVGILKESQSLDLLSVSRVSEKPSLDGKLPTWVPDWNNSDKAACLILVQISGQSSLTQPRYRASYDSVYHPVFKDDYSRLVLKGHIVDKIELLSQVLSDSGKQPGQHSQGNLLLQAMQEKTLSYLRQYFLMEKVAMAVIPAVPYFTYPRTGEPLVDAYWQTVMGGCTNELQPVMRYTFFGWWFTQLPIRIVQIMGLDADWVVELILNLCFWLTILRYRWRPEAYRKSQIVQPLLQIWKAATTVTGHRKMMKTSKGFIGLAPRCARVGDRIAICQGGKLPLVIRRRYRIGKLYQVIEEWELIGDSYVHGLTDGDLWTEEGGAATARDIVLI